MSWHTSRQSEIILLHDVYIRTAYCTTALVCVRAVCAVDECGSVETTATLEAHLDGDTAHDGLTHSGWFQL